MKNDDEINAAVERLTKRHLEYKHKCMTEPREWPPAEHLVVKWQYAGLTCAISRGINSYCGYVHVPADHPWANLWYDDVRFNWDEIEIEFHELTFRCKSMENGAWFGFDTAHYFDFDKNKPDILKQFKEMGRGGGHTHKTQWSDVIMEEVMKETEQLAKEAVKVMPTPKKRRAKNGKT